MGRRAAKRLGTGLLFVLGTAIVGFGIPIVWLLIAAEIQGAAGVTRMTKATAIAVFPGIAISYLIVMYIVGWVATPRRGAERTPPPRTHHPWVRSIRDEPRRPERPTGLETVFIAATVVVGVAFMIWFFLWAGDPLPPT